MQIHNCPICGSNKFMLEKIHETAGWNDNYTDWRLHCERCHMYMVFPADDFYDREYYKTEEDVIKIWNELCEKYGH